MANHVHCYVMKVGLSDHVKVGNAGVDDYGKCGNEKASKQVFDVMVDRSELSWNAMLWIQNYI